MRIALCILLLTLGCEPAAAPTSSSAEPAPARVALPDCTLEAPRAHDGADPVLGDASLGHAALVVHRPGPELLTLGAEEETHALPLDRVHAIDADRDGWGIAGLHEGSGVLLFVDRAGAERRRLALPVALRTPVMRVVGDHAWLFGRVGPALVLLRAELLTGRVSEVRRQAVAQAAPLLAGQGRRAFASWTARGAEVWTLRGGAEPDAQPAPGTPQALAVGETPALFFRAPDRTGLWLHGPDGALLATQPTSRPEAVVARRAGDAIALLYASNRDVWLTRVNEAGERAAPVVVAPGARAAQLRGDARGLVIAWERDGQTHTRVARCP